MERISEERLEELASCAEVGGNHPYGMELDERRMIARELLAYRESGTLEALRAIQLVTADDEDRVGDERWRELWKLADRWRIYHADLSDASRLITRIAGAAIARLEVIGE